MSTEAGRPRDVAPSVRLALQALLKEGRRARLYAGRDHAGVSRFVSMYISGIQQALADLPVLLVEVGPDALRLGAAELLGGGGRGDIPDALYSEGVRAISVEAGATDDELLHLGRLLLAPWGPEAEESLTDAIWMADFHHVAFEVVERIGDADESEGRGDSPLLRNLAGLVEELNRAGGEEGARIRQDELALLLRLREELGEGATVATDAHIGPSLRAEAEACRADEDLDDIDQVALLGRCAVGVPEQAGPLLGALLLGVLDGLEAGDEAAAARLRDHADEVGGDPRLAALLAEWPVSGVEVRHRLVSLVQARGEALNGPLFTLFGLLRGEAARLALCTELPAWAVRVLADAWLVDDPPREPSQAVKALLARAEPAALHLGLALARRVDAPPLVEPILALTDHAEPSLREEALVALRRYQTPRIRDAVHRRLDDAVEAVRLEALRYVVAYRDTDVATRLEARLMSQSQASDAEMRALGIAIGKLLRERAETHLIPVALGARAAPHPFAAKAALHGLRAVGSATARSAIARIGAEVPALSELAQELLER